MFAEPGAGAEEVERIGSGAVAVDGEGIGAAPETARERPGGGAGAEWP